MKCEVGSVVINCPNCNDGELRVNTRIDVVCSDCEAKFELLRIYPKFEGTGKEWGC